VKNRKKTENRKKKDRQKTIQKDETKTAWQIQNLSEN
jgi:hypothetical protein